MRILSVCWLAACIFLASGRRPVQGVPDDPVHTVLLKVGGGHACQAEAVVFHPAGKYLATPCALWDIEKQALVARLAGKDVFAGRVCYSPGGKRLYRSLAGLLESFDGTTGKQLPGKREYDDTIEALAATADYLFVARFNLDIDVLKQDTLELVATLRPGLARDGVAVRCAAVSGDGGTLAAGYHTGFTKGEIVLWDLKTRKEFLSIQDASSPAEDSPVNPVMALRLSQDGKRVFSTGWHGRLKAWDGKTGKGLLSVPVAYHPSHFDISTDGKRFAMTSHLGLLYYGGAAAEQFVGVKILEGSARGVAISPDEKTIAVGDMAGNVRLFVVPPQK